MKKAIQLIFILAITGMVFSSCSKDEGMGGVAQIQGIVTYPDGAASNAVVHVSYGTQDATMDYDFSTIADENGNYLIDGLEKGDYFVDAEFTDQFGNQFNTPGYAVTIGKKSADLDLDIELE